MLAWLMSRLRTYHLIRKIDIGSTVLILRIPQDPQNGDDIITRAVIYFSNSTHPANTGRWANAGPSSTTLAQHISSIGSTFRACLAVGCVWQHEGIRFYANIQSSLPPPARTSPDRRWPETRTRWKIKRFQPLLLGTHYVDPMLL